MDDGTRVYVISVSASSNLPATERDKPLFYWEHDAALVYGATMEDARKQAEKIAFETWPKEGGWSNHSASISEVTESIVTTLVRSLKQDLMTHKPTRRHEFFQLE
jgi:recombinational DNA repair ATPase RecF